MDQIVSRRQMLRRSLLVSTLPMLAFAEGNPVRAATSALPPFGASERSESVLLAAVDPAAHRGFQVRLCRYPRTGVTWVWAQVFAEQQVYSFTDTSWPATHEGTKVETDRVQYESTQGNAGIAFVRVGPRAVPRSASLRLNLGLHRNPFAPDGPGPIPVAIDAAFQPVSAADGILDGRSEIKGKVDATITIDGRSEALVAQGHFHEQQQEKPRFVDPFVYFSGWGDGISFTLLQGVAASGGVMFSRNGEKKATGFSIEAPSASRRFRVKLEGGRVLDGHANARYVFGQRIYGDWRTSRIVTGTLDGQSFAGMLNDWQAARLPYLGVQSGLSVVPRD